MEKPVERPLRIKEAATFLGLKPSSLYGLCHKRAVPHYKRGKLTYFLPSELIAWLTSERVKTKTEIELEAKQRIREASK